MRESIFGVGLMAKSPNVSAQRRLNLYLEFRPEDDGIRVVAQGTPGLSAPLVDFGDTPPRGEHNVGNFLYVVHRGTLWAVNNAGVAVNRGTLLTTSGRVYFADNGVKIMLVDGQFGYTYDTVALTFAQIVDPDFPTPLTVTWLDRYYIVNKAGTGRFYISAIDDPTSWDALDFANAEASPDNLMRVLADHGELLLFGDLTIEPWGDSGTADFPFTRLGSAAIEWGLAAPESLVKFDSSIMFLGRNRMGESQVVVLNGYTPSPVAGQDFLYAINSYSTVGDATAFSYMQSGHAFYQINFPTANASWLYDGSTKAANEMQSDTGRHRANHGVLFLGKMAVADYATGKIYRLDQNSYTDNGAPIAREIISRHIFSDKFQPIHQLWVDMEVGVGLPGYSADIYGTNYLNAPGTSSDYASTPNSAAVQIVGDIEFICYVSANDWTSGANQGILGRGPLLNLSYYFGISSTGHLIIAIAPTSSGGGATAPAQSPTILPGVDGTPMWLRYRRAAATDVCSFDYSNDPPLTAPASVSWTSLGTATTGFPGNIFAGTGAVHIGESIVQSPFHGKVYLANIYLGLGGTLKASFNPSNGGFPTVGSTSFASILTGETWTINGAATINFEAEAPANAAYFTPQTQGTNPQVMLAASEDRGRNWGPEIWRTLGKVGDYLNRVIFNRIYGSGNSYSMTLKLRITDPVKVTIMSEGWLE